jgi:hypothetical protein
LLCAANPCLEAAAPLLARAAAATVKARYGEGPPEAGSLVDPRPPRGVPPLPQGGDILSWKALAKVTFVEKPERGDVHLVPRYGPELLALSGKDVKVAGFMTPLDPTGDRQKRFLLTKFPATCAFCLPGGPETMILVESRNAVKFGYEPLVIAGRLELMSDDSEGIFFKLKDASQAN